MSIMGKWAGNGDYRNVRMQSVDGETGGILTSAESWGESVSLFIRRNSISSEW